MYKRMMMLAGIVGLILGFVFPQARAATIFGDPYGKFAASNAVATDSYGDICVFTGGSIIEFTNSGMYIKTFWDGGPWQGHSGYGMAIDKADNLYISKMNEEVIVKIDSDGKDIPFTALGKNFIGSGKSGLAENELQRPAHLCIDKRGYIYVADYSSIKKFNPDGSPSKDFGGHNFIGTPGQEGSDAKHFKNALGVAVDKDGNIYVADSGNYRVMVYDKKGNPLRSVPQGYMNGPAPQKVDDGFFGSPVSCAVDEEGNLYVGDFTWGTIKTNRIQKFDKKGNYIASTKRGIFVTGLYYDQKTGSLYAGCIWNRSGGIQKFDKGLNYTGTIGAYPDQEGTFQGNTQIAIDDNEALYVCEPSDNSRLQKISAKDGSFIKMIGANRPQSVTVDNKSKVIYLMENDGKVKKLGFDLNDMAFDLKFEKPGGICVDKNGNLYVSLDKKIYLISPDGKDKKIILTGISGDIKLDNQGNIYIAEPRPGESVYKFPPYKDKVLSLDDSLWSHKVGPFPVALAVDSKNNLFVALDYSSRIIILNQEGNLVTVNGKKSFGEYGGLDIQDGYHLLYPQGLAISGDKLYVSDGHGIIKYSLKYNADGSIQIIP